MRIIGLDKKQYELNLGGHTPKESDIANRSKGHLLARKLLQELFPADRLLEELYLLGSNGLYADFYLPFRKLMVEVHGRQHFEFVPHFHKDKWNWYASKKRDMNKAEWCQLNNISLLVLRDDQTDGWREQASSI